MTGPPITPGEGPRRAAVLDLDDLSQSKDAAHGAEFITARSLSFKHLAESQGDRGQALILDKAEEAFGTGDGTRVKADHAVDGEAGVDQPELLPQLDVGLIEAMGAFRH